MVWPSGLAVFYPYRHETSEGLLACSILLLVIISALAWFSRRQRPYVAVGWLWFLGTLVPVIGVVQVGQQAMANRYTYLPLVGVFIAFAYGIKDLVAHFHFNPARVSVAAGLILGALLVCTEHQLQYWQNTETLFGHALAVTKNN